MKITEFSIKHHLGVMVFCVGLLLIGTYSYFVMPRESFPDISVSVITILTVLDGANPSDVESSVTIPIESAIDGTEGVKKIHSNSQEGMSVVSVEFFPDVPIETAKQRIRDAIDEARNDLPDAIEEPSIKEIAFSDIPILVYNLVGNQHVTRSELEDLADTLEDEIKQVKGVLDVTIVGGREREVLIEIDPERLHFYNLSIDQVIAVVTRSNRNVSAGATTWGNSRIITRLPGEFRNADDIQKLVIGQGRNGSPIYLIDVAVPRFDFVEELSRSRAYDFLGKDGVRPSNTYAPPRKSVSIQITKRSGENILELSKAVDALFSKDELPPSIQAIKTMDQSKDVRMMVADLENGIGTSLILVVLVIFIGLGFSNAVLVSMAVPFSMLLSIIILRFRGETLNMMVLFSLILALGMLVDNAIVIVENVYRHFCMGVSRTQAAIDGTKEVAWPVITSTATTVGAFAPMLFWPGIMGQFMSYLPLTVIIVLSSSLFVALVVNPTLCSMFMKRKGGEHFIDPETHRPDYPAVRLYRKILEYMLTRPGWTLNMAGALLILVMVLFGTFGAGMEFFPPQDPKNIYIDVTVPEGSSLDETDRFCRMAEDRIFGAPNSSFDSPVQNLKSASATISLAAVGGGGPIGQAGPINVQIDFVDREYRTESTVETMQEVRNRIAGLNKAGVRVCPPLYEADFNVIRPKEGPPTGHPVSIEIYGDDLNQMASVANDVKRIIRETPGTVKPTDDASIAAPTLEWDVDLAAAGVSGMDRGTIGDFLQLGIGGRISSTYGHGDDEQDIRLRFSENARDSSSALFDLHVPSLTGGSVPIGTVATANLVPGPVTIKHYQRKRVVRAGAEVRPDIRADASIRDAFKKQVKGYSFPPGITHEFGGAAEEEEAAKTFLVNAFVIAVFVIIMILVLQFNSLGVTAIVMVSVFLSLIGVFLGLLIFGFPFGIIMTGIAVISLAGIVVNNAIVLLDAILKFHAKGWSAHDSVVSASMIRFRPVLLTAITTMLGLLPMAIRLNLDFRSLFSLDLMHVFQYNTDSSQWWQGMAIAIICGLLVATILTLGVVPTLAMTYCRFKDREKGAIGDDL